MQDAWLRELRGKLLPRLRKFLFHPDFMTRRMMIPLLGLLGSLETDPFSDPARRNQLANSPTNGSRTAVIRLGKCWCRQLPCMQIREGQGTPAYHRSYPSMCPCHTVGTACPQ